MRLGRTNPRGAAAAGKHGKHGRLGVFGGLAALGLDALSSVAYGPEAMMLVLLTAGTGALHAALPLTLVIAGMLGLLVVSYSQVIAAHPDGGGAYAVAKQDLGRRISLLAAASLVVDYVLTVAVSLAAGAASLGSAFPSLAHHLLLVSLAALVVPDGGQPVRPGRVGEGVDAADRAVRGQRARGDRRSGWPARRTRSP